MSERDRSKLVVGIATTGRREALTDTLRELGRQTRLADEVLLAPACEADVDESALVSLPYATRIVRGPAGLPNQRNTILDQLGDADAVVFFDDDFYPAPDYLRHVESLLLAHPSAVGLTGKVLADGKLTRGIPHLEALAILANDLAVRRIDEDAVREMYSLYGCNMVLRLQTVFAHQLRFDTNLPLYGWLEDLDFTRQMARYGSILECEAMRGVHLATKAGRTSGVKFGYSQVANPLYLARKGTMEPRRALAQTSRNMARNLQRAVWQPEPWIECAGCL